MCYLCVSFLCLGCMWFQITSFRLSCAVALLESSLISKIIVYKIYCYWWWRDLEDRIGNQERWHRRNLHHFCTTLFADFCIIIFEFLCLSGLNCVHFIPSKSGELKDFIPSKSGTLKVWERSLLRSVTFGSSGRIQVDSLVTRPTAIYDDEIWKIV